MADKLTLNNSFLGVDIPKYNENSETTAAFETKETKPKYEDKGSLLDPIPKVEEKSTQKVEYKKNPEALANNKDFKAQTLSVHKDHLILLDKLCKPKFKNQSIFLYNIIEDYINNKLTKDEKAIYDMSVKASNTN